MGKTIDPKTGEILSFTNDDPNSSPGADFSVLSKGKTLQNEINAGRNLDAAEMGMSSSKVGDSAKADPGVSSNTKETLTSTGPQGTFTREPGGKWTDSEGNPYNTDPNGYSGTVTSSADTPTTNEDNASPTTKTIQDDYGNTITYDPNNPNPEAASAAPTGSDVQYGIVGDTNNSNSNDNGSASDTGNFGSSSSGGRDSNTMDATNTTGGNVDVPVDDQGASSDVGNMGSGVNSNVDPAMNQDNLGTTPTDIGTGQVTDNAVANSGDLSFGSGALVGDSDNGSSMSDTGQISNASTSAASGAASGELSSSLGSLSNVDLQGAMKTLGGSLGVAAGVLAKAGAIGALTGALTKGLGLAGVQGMAKAVQMAAVANIAKNLVGQVSNFLKTPSPINSAGDQAKMLATRAAANTGFPATASVNGTNVTIQPPGRPNDIINLAKGTPLATVPPEARAVANYVHQIESKFGYTVESGEEGKGGPSPPGMPKGVAETAFKSYGSPRASRAVVPAMEAVMFGVKAAALGKFTSLLPPMFKSLVPNGAIAGITNSGNISLGGLSQLVGGAALGAAASQALRSVGGINAVPGVSGMLGAQALNRTMGYGPIPVNIASTYGNAIAGQAIGNAAGSIASNLFGTNPNTSAVIANVVGTVSKIGLNSSSKGIPVSPQILGLATNVALRSVGAPMGIPLGVLGNAAAIASNPIGSIVGSLLGGRVPIIPTNLSIGNFGALSGLTQNLQAVGLAENIIPRSQLQGLIPGNLQNQIPVVPERMRGKPGFKNETEDKNDQAPRIESDEKSQPRVADSGPAKPAILTNAVQSDGSLNYDAKVSRFFTLGDMTVKVHGPLSAPVAHAKSPYTTKQHVEGLSWLAVNIMDVLWDNIGPIHVISGFRGPGQATPEGEHGKGAAQDITLKSQKPRSGAAKLANGITQLGLQKFCGWCALESSPGSPYGWLHLGGGVGHPTAKDTRWHPVSCWAPYDKSVKPKYEEGFLMRPGDR